jgi:hypothetical protein
LAQGLQLIRRKLASSSLPERCFSATCVEYCLPLQVRTFDSVIATGAR